MYYLDFQQFRISFYENTQPLWSPVEGFAKAITWQDDGLSTHSLVYIGGFCVQTLDLLCFYSLFYEN